MREELSELPRLLTAHLGLTLFPLLAGTMLSVPLGVLSSRFRRLEHVALNVAAVIQTVPSLALLALMVPLLGAIGATSIGYLPAFVALTLYSVLPVLRNTVTGLSGVNPALIEAARGVGMSPQERLIHVELPVAMPVIVAGVRTAAVWTVGAATLATPVGADSLGNYIFSGLQTRNATAVLVGCVACATLALSLDGLGRLLLAGVTRRSRRVTATAVAAFAALYLYAGASLAVRASAGPHDKITIGAKTFTEQYILSEIIARRIERTTGLDCEVKRSLGSSVVFDALTNGTIDAYVDYSGTIWTTMMKRRDAPVDRATLTRQMSAFLRQRGAISVVATLGFENGYALAMRRAHAEQLGIRTISDLSSVAGGLAIGGDYEFFARPEWRRLSTAYSLQFRKQTAMDSSLMYQAIDQGAVDVLSAFSTDGRIAALDLVVLDDDRRVIPPYDAVILVSQGLARRHPHAVEALRALSGRIDATRMRSMNRQADVEGRSPRSVAEGFLDGLAPGPRPREHP